MMTFDDGLANLYTGFDYMRDRGMVGTAYVITSTIDTAGYLTHEELVEMDGAGWAIANQTDTHPHMTTLTQAQQEAELTTAQAALDGWGLTRASREVAYPYGEFDATTLAAMAATGMLSGRTTAIGFADPATVDIMQIPIAVNVGSATSLDTVQSAIRQAAMQGTYCVLLFHGLVAAAPGASEWLLSRFYALVDWIQATNTPTRTILDL